MMQHLERKCGNCHGRPQPTRIVSELGAKRWRKIESKERTQGARRARQHLTLIPVVTRLCFRGPRSGRSVEKCRGGGNRVVDALSVGGMHVEWPKCL